MLSRTLGKLLVGIALFTVVLAVPFCMLQRHRSIDEIEMVSTRFFVSAGKLDLVRLRECLAPDDQSMMPSYLACVASKHLSDLNRNVQVDVRVEVQEVKITGGEATARLKCEVVERGSRLGKRVSNRFSDECTVFCVYDGQRWLVDLDRTVKDRRFPLANMSLFRECMRK